jgi:hypothetical protein
MHLRLRLVLLPMLLLGCGGEQTSLPVGFLNQTQHSNADLWTIWKAAQQTVATQIDINPVQDAPPIILAGDARALSVEPHQLSVAPRPDVSSQLLFAETGIRRNPPTGLIACPQPCNVRFAPAYSLYHPPLVRYAASWEFARNNFSTILQYEFENQILDSLGYDGSWR